jgi:hypothetical protein
LTTRQRLVFARLARPKNKVWRYVLLKPTEARVYVNAKERKIKLGKYFFEDGEIMDPSIIQVANK